jgi:hypothetical protein
MFEYWKNLSSTLKLASYVVLVASGLVSISAAWAVIEPFAPAHRAYVRQSEMPILDRLILAQLDINDVRRDRLIGEAKSRDLELQSDQAKTTPQYKAIVQDRVDRIKQELESIDKQSGNLFKEQKSR